jgi:uncharacterized damage-inducible protein DinB
MNYETIADVYETNANIREHLKNVVSSLSAEEADARPDGEKWSVREIVEHIATVDEGSLRICGKLVGEAKTAGKPGDGKVDLSTDFNEKSRQVAEIKLEAPERVQPTGEATIDDSLERMERTKQAFANLRSDFEAYDLAEHTFPHPFFGQITAAEWLVLAGGHEARHTKQIEKLLGSMRG